MHPTECIANLLDHASAGYYQTPTEVPYHYSAKSHCLVETACSFKNKKNNTIQCSSSPQVKSLTHHLSFSFFGFISAWEHVRTLSMKVCGFFSLSLSLFLSGWIKTIFSFPHKSEMPAAAVSLSLSLLLSLSIYLSLSLSLSLSVLCSAEPGNIGFMQNPEARRGCILPSTAASSWATFVFKEDVAGVNSLIDFPERAFALLLITPSPLLHFLRVLFFFFLVCLSFNSFYIMCLDKMSEHLK